MFVYTVQIVYLSVVFLLIIQHYDKTRRESCCVLYTVSGLFLYNDELYSRKRSIVYKDADVDLIIFIRLAVKVLFLAL